MSSIRSIFVTGANQGQLGNAHRTPTGDDTECSRKLPAAEEARAKFASDIHPSSTIVPVQLDISDDTSVKNAHAFIAKYLQEKNIPGLDVLVNNAALGAPTWEETYAVNVFGTAKITDAIRPLLKNGGAILNISSGLGSISSKAALNSLTVQWAVAEEEKKSGIRVVSICPGLNATNLNNYISVGGNPADGCKVIVNEALAKEGKSSVFIHKDGEYLW
ncbi:hypothetical protein B0H13DRAFT_2649292 [Mycena leptocephala]|nr:hypothetical protein B0H13DRAFT_2649292 [Mycena leptocephala]